VKLPAAKLKLKHLAVLTTFTRRQQAKHRTMLQALSSLFVAELRDCPWALIAVLIQLQHLRVLPKFLVVKLELEHYLVPITSVVMRK